MIRVVIAVLVGVMLVLPGSAVADSASDCGTSTDLGETYTDCTLSVGQVTNAIQNAAPNEHYKLIMECWNDRLSSMCANPRLCPAPPGTVLYAVLRSVDGQPFLQVGAVCMTAEQAAGLGAVSTQLIIDRFKTYDWPASEVSVQPPDGRTLVNLATNFFTSNTAPTTLPINLGGFAVEIEATPVSWTWHYGDGVDQTTDDPGAAYPALDVTHTYTTAHVTVHPSVDTVYHGRYRINGGAWHDIADERTIAGAPVDLTVLEARPVLVAPNG